MSKKCPKFLIIFVFLVMSKKLQKFPPNFTSISSYFNSSYYSFLTFLTLYLISFKISQEIFLMRPNGGILTPKTFLPTPLIPTMRVHFAKSMCASCGLRRILKLRVSSEAGLKMGRNVPEHVRIETACH